MREVEIIAVGKLKESYWRSAESYFIRELTKKVKCTIITVEDEKTKDGAGIKEIDRVKGKEGEKIQRFLDPKAMVMAMDLKGKTFSSSEFSKVIQKNLSDETKVQIVIGGSLGISDSILNKAQKRITFSKMTYPHQLFRIMVLEELSRALV